MDKTPEGKKYRGEGRVTFLANLSSIQTEINEGWPLKAVYDRHQDRLSIGYMQFVRYVDKYVNKKAAPPRAKKQADSQPTIPVVPQMNNPYDDYNAQSLPDTELF